jgi:hypothetical protein
MVLMACNMYALRTYFFSIIVISPGIISVMFSLATQVLINECIQCKAQSNCIHDPTFRHSSLVSSILTVSAVLFSVLFY